MKKSHEASTTTSSLKAASTNVEFLKVPAAVATTLKASTTVAVSVEALTTVQDTLNAGPNNHVTPKEAKKESKAVKKEISEDTEQVRVPVATQYLYLLYWIPSQCTLL